jgi:uncharacterized protein YciI
MAFVVLGYDGTDEAAPARRLAARDEHVAFITGEAKAGRLALGLPLHDEAAHSIGSLMVLDVPDRAAALAYMAQEPFARGVWQRTTLHPFRIAPLPYAPWPSPGSAMPGPRSHTVVIALDGTDEDAPARRQAARPAHFERVRPLAEDGTLLFGGAILDAPDGGMIGSIAVTRHMDHEAARRFWAEDPYVTGDVWRQISLHATLLRPLPYKPLPR